MTNRKIIYKPIAPEIEKLAQDHGGNREAVLEVLTELGAENRPPKWTGLVGRR